MHTSIHTKTITQPDVSSVLRQLEAGSIDAEQLIKQVCMCWRDGDGWADGHGSVNNYHP